MRITHLGHSAALVEVDGTRILFDPGNFSDAWHDLTDLDAICVTHQHADHADPAYLPALVRNNPGARVFVEPTVPDHLELPGATRVAADTSVELGGVTIHAVGGLHAVIHRDIPRIGNVGMVVTCEGEPTLFHPGDMLDTVPAGIDVLAVPAYGPWAAVKETIDFVRAVGAPQGFLIHDGLLNERGYRLVFDRMGDMTSTRVEEHRGQPWDVVAG